MRKTILLFLIFFSINSYCQKQFEISEDQISQLFYESLDSLNIKYGLKDLRETDDRLIRIWNTNDIISLGEHPQYIFHIHNGEKEIVEKRNLANNFNLDSLFHLFRTKSNPKNNQIYIDAFPKSIELNSSNGYNLYSFYRNKQLEELIRTIRKENSINDLREEIIRNLPAGDYRYGMTGLKIDHLPKEEKSDFYLKLEPEINSKLKVTEKTLPTEMPLILINNKPHFFQDLNELTLSNVEGYEIIFDKMEVLYGTQAKFGIIKVNTN